MALDPKQSAPQVSLIIPTYNREEELCETLRCALAQTYPRLEIVIVDQASAHTPSTRAFLEQAADRIRSIRSSPPNLPLARNRGVEHARGEIIIFADDDVTFGPEFVESHVAYYQAEPEIGGVAGRVEVPPAARPFHPVGAYASEARGCNMSYRRQVIFEVGGFDPRFSGNARGEEIDFVRRLRRRGYRLANGARATLFHHAAPSSGTWREYGGGLPPSDRWLEDYFRNLAFGFGKRFPGGAWLLPLFVLKNWRVYWRHRAAAPDKRAFRQLFWKSHRDAVRLLRQPAPASFLSGENSFSDGR
jgi:GT2 family glycosyltransferase